MAWRPRFELAVVCAVFGALSHSAMAQTVVVDATPSHAVNAFSPIRALGAGVDRLRAGEGAPEMDRGSITKEEVEQNTDKLLSGPILKATLGAGWQAVTYRQNTELQIEAWHWNPHGSWSDPQKQAGYFTGSAEPAEAIHHSWAYPLPHRGDTVGDGDGAILDTTCCFGGRSGATSQEGPGIMATNFRPVAFRKEQSHQLNWSFSPRNPTSIRKAAYCSIRLWATGWVEFVISVARRWKRSD